MHLREIPLLRALQPGVTQRIEDRLAVLVLGDRLIFEIGILE
jgi:hypothetical protein